MPELVNTHRTNACSITVELPGDRRAAKALAVVRAIRAKEEPAPVFVPFSPPRLDPTYTFYGHPNDTLFKGSVVYFMYSAGRIKIGYSAELRARHMGLKKSGPYPPVLLLLISGTEKDERKLHAKFEGDRLHGEWFALSPKIRSFLNTRLCDRGLASLEKADADFRDCCASFIQGYKTPPKRQPRQVCEHGLIIHHPCKACERERDLKILEKIR